jgi:hypothetical protein
MGIGYLITTIIGAACTVMGIIIALAEKIQVLEEFAEYVGLSWVFWLMLAVIFSLITIAFAVSRGSSYE